MHQTQLTIDLDSQRKDWLETSFIHTRPLVACIGSLEWLKRAKRKGFSVQATALSPAEDLKIHQNMANKKNTKEPKRNKIPSGNFT